LGHRFEEIAQIINKVREPERLCVCLDTAHIFAAGYDISSESAVKKTFREFDRVIGHQRLGGVSLNNSKRGGGRITRTIPKARVVHTLIGTRTSARARSDWRHFVSS